MAFYFERILSYSRTWWENEGTFFSIDFIKNPQNSFIYLEILWENEYWSRWDKYLKFFIHNRGICSAWFRLLQWISITYADNLQQIRVCKFFRKQRRIYWNKNSMFEFSHNINSFDLWVKIIGKSQNLRGKIRVFWYIWCFWWKISIENFGLYYFRYFKPKFRENDERSHWV